jgi:hypothetical protein
VLYVAAENPGQFALGDLALVLAVTLALVLVVYAGATILFRGRAEGMLPALLTFLALAWAFGAPPLEEWLTRADTQVSPVILVIGSFIVTAILTFGLVTRPRALKVGATFLTLIYSLLVFYLAGMVAMNWARGQERVAASPMAAEFAQDLTSGNMKGELYRDVYVILLDEYDNSPTLKEVLGYDNGSFEDSLRALGFHIPISVTSNYAHTYLSLPSILNAMHVHRVESELPQGSDNPTLLNHLVARSRVARFLQELGYRFVFYPSAWWNSTRTSPLADSVVEVLPDFSLERELSRTEFRRVIRRNTILWRWYNEAGGDHAIMRGTLEGISRLPAIPGPVFAVAHIMSPHPPHVFGPSCGRRRTEWRRDPASYVADLECVNRLLLMTVSRLIQDSEVPPVIILQSDHGSAFRGFADAPTVAHVSAPAARERFGAFGAYYLPENGAAAFGDSVTAVNVLGHVLRYYFGADLLPEPDQLLLSVYYSPFDFRRIASNWLAGEESAQPSAVAGQSLRGPGR